MVKYLSKILSLTFLFSCITTTFLLFIFQSMRPLPHNRMRCDMSGIVYGIGIGLIIFLTIGCLPIFFNLKKKIRKNIFYSVSSFFLVPSIITILSIIYMGDFSESIKEYSAMFIPFFSILTYFFHRFRKSKFISSKKIIV